MECSFVTFFLLSFLCFLLACKPIHGDPQVPCYFILGDSLSDNGNNNNRLTTAKSNYPPYGIDYPQGPTGRFSNGKNLQDVIVELLGFSNPIPPFTTANGSVILKGVNYASGGGGLLDTTDYQQGSVIPMSSQIRNHAITISQITGMLGRNRTAVSNLLGECIYALEIGQNDYINNYFAPEYHLSSRIYTPQQFATLLLQQYEQDVKILYGLGARKFAMFALVPTTGCAPYLIEKYGITNGSCVQPINDAVAIFNTELLELVNELNTNISNANFTYIQAWNFSIGDLITSSTCCQVRSGEQLCIPDSVPCLNRSNYVQWDAVHPTEVVYTLAGNEAYGSTNAANAHPYNIQQLALQ